MATFVHQPLRILISPAISRPMLNASARIIVHATRTGIAVAERSRGFSSLLLLGLTRGCRVR